MRKITLIVVHCSANREGSALRMEDIDRYHRSLGWKGCGYHYVIPTDGTIEVGRPEEEKGAHCKNHNSHSIRIRRLNLMNVSLYNISQNYLLYQNVL